MTEPRRFLKLAQEQHLLSTVDLQCLKVCLSAARRLPAGTLAHVNVYPSTLIEVPARDLSRLLALCSQVRLCLELCEGRPFDTPKLIDRLVWLRAEGVRIAVDHVGLERGLFDDVLVLEPDVIKIDPSVVRGVAQSPRQRKLIQRLAAAAAVLGCEVVAEGVEDPMDVAALIGIGISRGQGFLFSRPVEAESLAESA